MNPGSLVAIGMMLSGIVLSILVLVKLLAPPSVDDPELRERLAPLHRNNLLKKR